MSADNFLDSSLSYNPTPDIIKNKKPYPIHEACTIMKSENERYDIAIRSQRFLYKPMAWVSFQGRYWIVLQKNVHGVMGEYLTSMISVTVISIHCKGHIPLVSHLTYFLANNKGKS